MSTVNYTSNGTAAYNAYPYTPVASHATRAPKLQVVDGYRGIKTEKVSSYVISARPIMSTSQVLATQVAMIASAFIILAMWYFL